MGYYLRVIPRDMFNEANLLKCYGQIYLNLERLHMQDCLVQGEDLEDPFDISMDIDGDLTIENVKLVVRGQDIKLRRPNNSRRAYPLYARVNDEEIEVFNDDGSFTTEMVNFLNGPTYEP